MFEVFFYLETDFEWVKQSDLIDNFQFWIVSYYRLFFMGMLFFSCIFVQFNVDFYLFEQRIRKEGIGDF